MPSFQNKFVRISWVFLVILSISIASCGTTFPARRTLATRADGVSVQVRSLTRHQDHDDLLVLVRNDSGDDMTVQPGRAVLRSGYTPSESARPEPPSAAGGVVVGGISGGADFGRAVARSDAGAFAGGVMGFIVALPIAGVVAGIEAASRPPTRLAPGASATYAVSFRTQLDHTPYSLDVSDMLGHKTQALTGVRMIDADDPHLGYGPPQPSPWVVALGLRAGYVGVLSGERTHQANFGLDVGFGARIGDVFELFAVLTPLFPSAGLDLRFHVRPSADVDVALYAGYGYEYQPFQALTFHRVQVGAEVLLPVITSDAFRWRIVNGELGLFGQTGVVVVDRQSVGMLLEGGVRFHAHL